MKEEAKESETEISREIKKNKKRYRGVIVTGDNEAAKKDKNKTKEDWGVVS